MALGTPDRTAGGGGTYLATVTRVTGSTCFVEVPRVAPGFEFGPAHYPSEYAPAEETQDAGMHSHTTPAGGTSSDGDHAHQLRPLAPGDRVAVSFLEGGHDDLVVLLRLA